MRTRWLYAAVIASAVAAASLSCADVVEPVEGSIEVLVGAQITDSAGAPPDTLLVRVRQSDDSPAAGLAVRFTGSSAVRLLGAAAGSDSVSVLTDVSGQAMIRVQLLGPAGLSSIEIEVPELGLWRSVPVTIVSGGLRLWIGEDSVPGRVHLAVGAERTLSPSLRDRSGNVAPGTPVCTTAIGAASVPRGCVLRGVRFGNDTLLVTASGVTLKLPVHVAPTGTIATDGEQAGVVGLWSLPDAKLGEVPRSRAPAWVPGADSLVVERSDAPGIWVVDRSGAGVGRRLAAVGLTPRLDAQGQWVFYVGGILSGTSGGSEIRRVRRAGSPDEGLVTDPARGLSSPSPSPDGTRVVFVESREARILEVGTGQTRTFARPNGPARTEIRSPAWSPAGDWIAWLEFDGSAGGGTVWVARSDGSQRRQLAPRGERALAWSPDGRYLLLSSWSDRDPGYLSVVELVTGVRVPTLVRGNAMSWK